MKYLLVASACLFSGVALAQVQPPVAYTFTGITPADVELIDAGLQTQPFGKVAPLMNKLREQIIGQQKPVDKPVIEEKKE